MSSARRTIMNLEASNDKLRSEMKTAATAIFEGAAQMKANQSTMARMYADLCNTDSMLRIAITDMLKHTRSKKLKDRWEPIWKERAELPFVAYSETMEDADAVAEMLQEFVKDEPEVVKDGE